LCVCAELLEDKLSTVSSLLALYIDDKYPPEQVRPWPRFGKGRFFSHFHASVSEQCPLCVVLLQLLEPLGLMVDQLDYLTPWLLMTVLHALGLGE
jgi:hypothetical protein